MTATAKEMRVVIFQDAATQIAEEAFTDPETGREFWKKKVPQILKQYPVGWAVKALVSNGRVTEVALKKGPRAPWMAIMACSPRAIAKLEAAQEAKSPKPHRPLFPVGLVHIDAPLLDTLLSKFDSNENKVRDFLHPVIYRHHHGRWGDMSDDDKAASHRAIKDGRAVFSKHKVEGLEIYAETDAQRRVTTLTMPDLPEIPRGTGGE